MRYSVFRISDVVDGVDGVLIYMKKCLVSDGMARLHGLLLFLS